MLVEHTLVDGPTRLGYAEGPVAGPPMVHLHRLIEDRRSFDPLLPHWSPHHHLFALDLRGHGTSTWTPGAYTLDDDACDVTTLLAERVPPRPVLFGHSYGALVAAVVASRLPDALEALVLVDPPLAALSDDRTSLAPLLEVFETIRALLVETGGGDAARSALLARFPGAELMADQTSRTDPERVASVIEMSAMQDHSYLELFAAVACPTLLLQADPARGAALSDHDARAALDVLANGRLVRITGAGHTIQDEAPAVYAREVLEFLKEAG